MLTKSHLWGSKPSVILACMSMALTHKWEFSWDSLQPQGYQALSRLHAFLGYVLSVYVGQTNKKVRSTFFFKRTTFVILLNWGFTVNSPYLSYLAWPAQSYKSHNTTSDLMLCWGVFRTKNRTHLTVPFPQTYGNLIISSDQTAASK